MFVQPDHTTLNEQDKASKQASQPACVCAWQKVIVIGQQLLFIKMPEKGERRCHVKKNTTFVEANGPAPPSLPPASCRGREKYQNYVQLWICNLE